MRPICHNMGRRKPAYGNCVHDANYHGCLQIDVYAIRAKVCLQINMEIRGGYIVSISEHSKGDEIFGN